MTFDNVANHCVNRVSYGIAVVFQFRVKGSPSNKGSFSVVNMLRKEYVTRGGRVIASRLLNAIRRMALSLTANPIMHRIVNGVKFHAAKFILSTTNFALHNATTAGVRPPLKGTSSFQLTTRGL